MKPAVAPKKSLGQHFLEDPRVLGRIAALSVPEPGSGLVEIGPGTGNLTAYLLDALDLAARPRRLITVERDRRMKAVLAERFGADVEVIEADAADVDWQSLLAELGPAPVAVGNLPYYAALPILFALLEAPRPPARMVLMVQKEVADRLVARPSTPDYGQISVKVQLVADVQLALKVGRGAFRPPPKVESTVLVVRPLAAPRHPVANLARFNALVTAGFGQRRKTLSNALQAGAGVDPEQTRAALRALGKDERSRGEALSVAEWAALATWLDNHAGGGGQPRAVVPGPEPSA